MQNRASLLRRDFISFGTLPVNYELGEDASVLQVFAEGELLFSAPLARSTVPPKR